jgi:phosphatidylglycerol:prolipoprotein diacylglycerol transferase
MFAIPFPLIHPIAITFGPISVHWYGLAYLVGISLAWGGARSIAGLFSISKKHVDDFITWAIVGIIVGGRLGYVLFYNPIHFLHHPIDILKTWEGGMAFHGGLAGVMIATIFYCRKMKIPLMRFADILAIVSPIGLFLGRIANFINAEHYGRTTDMPWGMIFPRSDGAIRHPSQLYEAVGEGLIIGLIMFTCLWFMAGSFSALFSKNPTPSSITAFPPGRLTGVFMCLYAVIRFSVEFLRHPDGFITLCGLTLTLGQALCLPMLIIGLYWVYRHTSDTI